MGMVVEGPVEDVEVPLDVVVVVVGGAGAATAAAAACCAAASAAALASVVAWVFPPVVSEELSLESLLVVDELLPVDASVEPPCDPGELVVVLDEVSAPEVPLAWLALEPWPFDPAGDEDEVLVLRGGGGGAFGLWVWVCAGGGLLAACCEVASAELMLLSTSDEKSGVDDEEP